MFLSVLCWVRLVFTWRQLGCCCSAKPKKKGKKKEGIWIYNMLYSFTVTRATSIPSKSQLKALHFLPQHWLSPSFCVWGFGVKIELQGNRRDDFGLKRTCLLIVSQAVELLAAPSTEHSHPVSLQKNLNYGILRFPFKTLQKWGLVLWAFHCFSICVCCWFTDAWIREAFDWDGSTLMLLQPNTKDWVTQLSRDENIKGTTSTLGALSLGLAVL